MYVVICMSLVFEKYMVVCYKIYEIVFLLDLKNHACLLIIDHLNIITHHYTLLIL
jgi:hypothetical protein